MSKNWYRLLQGSRWSVTRPDRPDSKSAPLKKPLASLTEGRGLSMFGYGDMSGRFQGKVTLSPSDIKTVIPLIAAAVIPLSAPPEGLEAFSKSAIKSSIPESLRDPGLDVEPEVYEAQAFKAGQALTMISEAWAARAFLDYLKYLRAATRGSSEALSPAIVALEGFLDRYRTMAEKFDKVEEFDDRQFMLEAFQTSQMETFLLSSDTFQVSGPVVLDIENSALCVRLTGDFALKLYPLNIDHQTLRAVMYAASLTADPSGNLDLKRLAAALRNPIFDLMSGFSAATDTSGEFSALDPRALSSINDPMSRTNYANQFGVNPENLRIAGGIDSSGRFNREAFGLPLKSGVSGMEFSGQETDYSAFSAPEDEAMVGQDSASLVLQNRTLTTANFCKSSQFMSRDLAMLIDLLSFGALGSSMRGDQLTANAELLDRMEQLRSFLLSARSGRIEMFSQVAWDMASPTLTSPALAVSDPEVLQSNLWKVSVSADSDTALKGLETYLESDWSGVSSQDLLDLYSRVKPMIDFTLRPVFDDPKKIYRHTRFDLLDASVRTLFEGVIEFISRFYLSYSSMLIDENSVGALDAEVVGSPLHVRDAANRVMAGTGLPPIASLLSALQTFGDGVFLANGQALLVVLDAAFSQTIDDVSDFLDPKIASVLMAPVMFEFPLGKSVGEALLGRLLASDQTMVATAAEKMAFVSLAERSRDANFAESIEAVMKAQLQSVSLSGIEISADPDTGEWDVRTTVAAPTNLAASMSPSDFMAQLVARPSRVLQVSTVLINKARSMYQTLASLR